MTVTSAAPLIDVRKVETGQTFSGEELTQIPTARDVWSLIQQIPGVYLGTVNVAGNASANVGGPAMTSKGSGNVVYQVDGATITDNQYGNPFARPERRRRTRTSISRHSKTSRSRRAVRSSSSRPRA